MLFRSLTDAAPDASLLGASRLRGLASPRTFFSPPRKRFACTRPVATLCLQRAEKQTVAKRDFIVKKFYIALIVSLSLELFPTVAQPKKLHDTL